MEVRIGDWARWMRSETIFGISQKFWINTSLLSRPFSCGIILKESNSTLLFYKTKATESLSLSKMEVLNNI